MIAARPIARCQLSRDVSAAVAFAREHDLEIDENTMLPQAKTTFDGYLVSQEERI
jgi:hypothetical protein